MKKKKIYNNTFIVFQFLYLEDNYQHGNSAWCRWFTAQVVNEDGLSRKTCFRQRKQLYCLHAVLITTFGYDNNISVLKVSYTYYDFNV